MEVQPPLVSSGRFGALLMNILKLISSVLRVQVKRKENQEPTSAAIEPVPKLSNDTSLAVTPQEPFSYAALLKSIEDDEKVEKTQLLSRVKRASEFQDPGSLISRRYLTSSGFRQEDQAA